VRWRAYSAQRDVCAAASPADARWRTAYPSIHPSSGHHITRCAWHDFGTSEAGQRHARTHPIPADRGAPRTARRAISPRGSRGGRCRHCRGGGPERYCCWRLQPFLDSEPWSTTNRSANGDDAEAARKRTQQMPKCTVHEEVDYLVCSFLNTSLKEQFLEHFLKKKQFLEHVNK